MRKPIKKQKREAHQSTNNFFQCSDEIILAILKHLLPQDLFTVSKVSKQFNKLAGDGSLWNPYIRELYSDDTQNYTKNKKYPPKAIFCSTKALASLAAFYVIRLVTSCQEIDEYSFKCYDGEVLDYDSGPYEFYNVKFYKTLENFKPCVIEQEIIKRLRKESGEDEEKLKAAINRQGHSGQTLAHFFTTADNGLKYLAEAGANLNAKDNWDNTPLHGLSINNLRNIDYLKFLLNHGADFKAKNDEGYNIQDIILYKYFHLHPKDFIKTLAFLYASEALSTEEEVDLKKNLQEDEIHLFDQYKNEFEALNFQPRLLIK